MQRATIAARELERPICLRVFRVSVKTLDPGTRLSYFLSVNEARPPIDFNQIVDRLKKLEPNPARVLTIPVWGWTGDGKTCAILTVSHYADPVFHGIGLGLVDDPEEFERAIANVTEYDGLRLPDLARSTAERLPALTEQFIDESSWPPGTDAPTPFLLKLRGIRKTYGFLYLPDLQGGSYRGVDGPARAVLNNADACAIMVDPIRYTSVEVDGKRYKDSIDTRIQMCVEKGIPAAIMISKADSAPPDNRTQADKTQVRLTRMIEDAKSVQIFRVSILGEEVQSVDESLPPASARKPIALLYAWSWLLAEALAMPAPDKMRVPPVKLAATAAVPQVHSLPIPEVRNLGEFSSSPGRVLCALDQGTPAFLLLEGDQLRVATLSNGGDKPAVQRLGKLVDFVENKKHIRAESLSGSLFLGPPHNTNTIWHGTLGDNLTKVGLPFQMKVWVAVDGQRVAGVDESGRVHLLIRKGDRWEQQDFIVDFTPSAPRFVCAYISRAQTVVVGNGNTISAVKVERKGFGDQQAVPLPLRYNPTSDARVSSSGIAVVYNDENHTLEIVYGPESFEFELELAAMPNALSLRPDSPWVATVTSDRQLTICHCIDGKVIWATRTPTLSAEPTGLVWGMRSSFILVTFESSWAVFQARGFAHA